MSDEQSPAQSAGTTVDETARPARPTRTRRHLVVLALALLGIVVGSTLVLTGRDSDGDTTSTPTPTTVATRVVLLPSLGAVADQAAAMALLGDLDPNGLERPEPTDSTSTTGGGSATTDAATAGVDESEAGLQRCQQAIAQQNTDRSLGSRLDAARLDVGTKPTFVVAYALPASGTDPAVDRIVLVDARTCRVLGAVDH